MSAISESLGLVQSYAMRPFGEVAKGYTYFEEGDLLFAKITPCMQNGKHAIVRNIPGGFGFGSTEFHVIRVSDRVDPGYLWYFLRQPIILSDAATHFQGAVGQQRVPPSYLKNLTIPLPAVSVQRRIVAKLDEQMAALDRAGKALAEEQAAALAFKRTTLQTALDQATHPEWECAALRELCTFANGLWTGKKPPFHQASVIRNTNFTSDCTLDFSDIAHLDVEESQLRSRRLRAGDIILERSGGGPKQPVGRVALFELDDESYSFSNFTSVIRVNERSGVVPRFLWYYLFHLYKSGVTQALQNHTSGIRNLAFSSYVMLSVPVPTLDQQRRIVEYLDWSIEQANSLLLYVAEQALTLASLRTSFLDAAFSGET
jgi:type I restriction enzyme S subunit